jgi:hypothetical protein
VLKDSISILGHRPIAARILKTSLAARAELKLLHYFF